MKTGNAMIEEIREHFSDYWYGVNDEKLENNGSKIDDISRFDDDNIDALLKHLDEAYIEDDYIEEPKLFSNINLLIKELCELSYYDIEVNQVPLKIDGKEKLLYKLGVRAPADRVLSQYEIDTLIRSLKAAS